MNARRPNPGAAQIAVREEIEFVAAAGGELSLRDRPPGLPEQLPRHPQEEKPAGQHQADHVEKLGGEHGEEDAEQRCRGDADHDRLPARLVRQPRSGHSDHDRVVAGQNQIDDDHADERGQFSVNGVSPGWGSASGRRKRSASSGHLI